MVNHIFSLNSGNAKHRWTFFRAGGFDQIRLDSGCHGKAADRGAHAAGQCPAGSPQEGRGRKVNRDRGGCLSPGKTRGFLDSRKFIHYIDPEEMIEIASHI
jgi:hypothetical protein